MPKRHVNPINNGTVIDHLPSGTAYKILKILKLLGNNNKTIITAVAVTTNKDFYKDNRKDFIMIEDVEVDLKTLDQIALVAPRATINKIRDSKVDDKHKVEIPSILDDILYCANSNCITNKNTPRGEGYFTSIANIVQYLMKNSNMEYSDALTQAESEHKLRAPEPITPKFEVLNKTNPLKIKCYYCEKTMTGRDVILNNLI